MRGERVGPAGFARKPWSAKRLDTHEPNGVLAKHRPVRVQVSHQWRGPGPPPSLQKKHPGGSGSCSCGSGKNLKLRIMLLEVQLMQPNNRQRTPTKTNLPVSGRSLDITYLLQRTLLFVLVLKALQ